MLEGLSAIYKRIDEIKQSFNKLGFSQQPPVKKSFQSHLEEQMGEKLSSLNPSESQKTFVPSVPTPDMSSVSTNRVEQSASVKNGFAVYAKKASEETPVKIEPSTIYDSIIEEAAKKFKIPRSLIKAVIKQESNYDANAVSKRGAYGLMQLMPSTASALGIDLNMLSDAKENIFGGSKLLSSLISRYNGDLEKSLAAYNAGTNAVDKADGVPEIAETKDYVSRVLKYYVDYGGM